MKEQYGQTEDNSVDKQKHVDHHMQSNSFPLLGTEGSASISPTPYLLEYKGVLVQWSRSEQCNLVKELP